MILDTLDLDQIKPHDGNVRRNLGDLTELAASIAGQGVLQPLVVARTGNDYVLIAGHRRLAAAKEAGLTNVPCVIRTDLDTRAAQLQAMLTENLQRTDLTVMEEAVAYEQLQLLGVKPAAIAKTTGRSKKTVDSRLRLMSLPEQTRAGIDDGQITLADAEWLTQYADDQELMDVAAKAGSGRDARWRVEALLRERVWKQQEAERAKAAAESKPTQADQERARAHEAASQRRQQLTDMREISRTLRVEWIKEQIAADSTTFWDGVARLTAAAMLDNWDNNAESDLMGIPNPDPDEDFDDHLARVDALVKSWPIAKVHRFITLNYADIIDPPTWSGATRTIQQLVEFCGYQPTEGERELMALEAGQ